MAKTIVLVACVSKKHEMPMSARLLYCSPWFEKASAYADRIGDEGYILSAKYGLVRPDQVIQPYNETLNTMSAQERRTWAKKVALDLQKILHSGDRVIFLAGIHYREYLIEPIKRSGCSIEIPMEGLRIGEQLGWLNQRVR
jgi:cytoplasmic iron level regulating protein YaaA (DUF328/UPF0246 family)